MEGTCTTTTLTLSFVGRFVLFHYNIGGFTTVRIDFDTAYWGRIGTEVEQNGAIIRALEQRRMGKRIRTDLQPAHASPPTWQKTTEQSGSRTCKLACK